MAQLQTESARHPLRRLHEDIHRVLKRWRARRQEEEYEQDAEQPGSLARGYGGALWRESEFDETWPPAVTENAIRIDVEETDDEIIVLAELPGMSKGDFTVEVTEDSVVLQGEKRHGREEQGSGYHYAECSYGTFARRIMLPSEINPRKAKARYKNGVLRITLPKTAQAKAKRIEVQVQ